MAGRALPARHYGSVDVFLEALGSAAHGDVLVVDNGGRADEACVAIWSCWRHKWQPWAAWWCGGCTATRRNWPRSPRRPSPTADLGRHNAVICTVRHQSSDMPVGIQ
jgi:hypothetical protein